MDTMTSICWGFSNMAFDASTDDDFPNPLQRVFGFWGSFWFWMAMAFRGDAIRYLGEMCDEAAKRHFKRAGWPSSRNLETPLTSTAGYQLLVNQVIWRSGLSKLCQVLRNFLST